MSFPTMNAHAVSMSLVSKPVATTSPVLKLLTGTFGYSLFDIPGVVDVSGMEFGMSISADAATTLGDQVMASGASTVNLRFAELSGAGTQGASVNYLLGTATLEFSNTLAGGWAAGEMKNLTGLSTKDIDADDIVGLQVYLNISGAGGLGAVNATVAYIEGKPSTIN